MTTAKTLTLVLFGVFFIGAGAYLPWHSGLVMLSGVAEIALGALLLIPRFQVMAAWGLIALLIAVFPANVNMTMHPELYPTIAQTALWIRLPIQGLLIAWAYWYTKR